MHSSRYPLEEFFLAASAFGEESIWSWRKWRAHNEIFLWVENKISSLRVNKKISPFPIMGFDDIQRERVEELI